MPIDNETLGAAVAIAKANPASEQAITNAVNDWLDDHPEATTTVQDGSITKAKLDNNLKVKVDELDSVKSAIEDLEAGSLSAVGASAGQVPTADGDGSWEWSDELPDQLKRINVYIGSVESLTWAERMAYVRNGFGPDMFPVGTQFNVNHGTLGSILFDVVAHNHFKNPNNLQAPTMTLLAHYAIQNAHMCYTQGGVIYGAENGLTAGDYCFTIAGRTSVPADNGKTVYFTLLNNVPVGGQIRFMGAYNKSYSVQRGGVFATPYDTTATETFNFTFTEIQGATNLGTQGTGDLCDGGCVDNGLTDYDISDVRCWLNSDGDVGEWYEAPTLLNSVGYYHNQQTSAGSLMNYYFTMPGFLHDIDQSFLACVGECDYPCASNALYSYSRNTLEAYTLRDKFILPSVCEIGGGGRNFIGGVQDGTLLDYFSTNENVQRIKYTSPTGNAVTWWTRSPERARNFTNKILVSRTNGETSGDMMAAGMPYGIVIMCTLY